MTEKKNPSLHKVLMKFVRDSLDRGSLIKCDAAITIDPGLARQNVYNDFAIVNAEGKPRDIFQWYITDINKNMVAWLHKTFGLNFVFSSVMDLWVLVLIRTEKPWTLIEVPCYDKDTAELYNWKHTKIKLKCLGGVETAALIDLIKKRKTRSQWDKGVIQYALELLEDFKPDVIVLDDLSKLLNGAQNWEQYSYGGCTLITDYDIAERLCSASNLKKHKDGELPPSEDETWLDVQARALRQAVRVIREELWSLL